MEPVISSAPFMPPIDNPASREASETPISVSSKLLLLGDLTFSFDEDLSRLLHYRQNGLLQSFFARVSDAIRQEVGFLPLEQQEWMPRFTNLVDLLSNLPGTTAEPAVRFAMLCVYQIGRFILADFYPLENCSAVIGICAGSFGAAAIASSSTVQELAANGIRATIIALRTALQSLVSRQDAVPNGSLSTNSAWAYVVMLSEAEVETSLNKFQKTEMPSPSSHPYVSAVTGSAVTVSGEPNTVKRFCETSQIKSHPLSIYTPFHALHLIDEGVVHKILDQLPLCSTPKSTKQQIPIICPSSGECFRDLDFTTLLQEAIRSCLYRPVRWDKVCSSVCSVVSPQADLISCTIYPVASHAVGLLGASLQTDSRITLEICHNLNRKLETAVREERSEKFQDSKIAIVGFSGRYPEAASNEELWDLLMATRDCHRTIPEDRFDWKAYYDPEGKKKNHSRVKYGCFINDAGFFDARFFNLSPREAENTDPAQRLALMTAYEAVEMAGMVLDRTPSTQRDRVGVFYGVTSDDWREVNSGQDVDTYFIPGGNRAFIPGRISYFLRLSGPSMAVDTACSSSFAAISTACAYLWQGDCDCAIAGGTNILTNSDNFVGLDRGHFLSTTGNCDSFDDTASGYCRADAVGSVVLKRLEDAQADGDPIFGVIVGSKTNHCGQTVSITRPHEGDQLSLFRRILRQTNTDPTDVSYVEMHGTGTQAGDATEMQSVLSAFAWDYRRSEATNPRPLHLGAIKANVGHSESASGVTALIKVLMMMQRNIIPPHRIDGEFNKNYPKDLAARNVHIALKATPWNRDASRDGKRRVFLNNFSAAGGNTAILLEDAPLAMTSNHNRNNKQQRSIHPVAISARTAKAFEGNLRAIHKFLVNEGDAVSLPALSYTTTARRMHHKLRIMVFGSSLAVIRDGLEAEIQKLTSGDGVQGRGSVQGPKLAFAFTGQGTLYAGIGRELFEQYPPFREHMIRFDGIAQRLGFPSILRLVTLSDQDLHSIEPLEAQLSVACLQMALSCVWTVWCGKPTAITGHSLGEYAALYAAGVLSATDTIYLVGCRGRLMQEHCEKNTNSMLAIKVSAGSIENYLKDFPACEVACINSPTATVVSGPLTEIDVLASRLKVSRIECTALQVPYAFHSKQVEPMLSEFQRLANSVVFHPPTVPYLSPALAKVINVPGLIDSTYLIKATRSCVNFYGSLDAALQAGIVAKSTLWLELGSHPACSGMIKQTIGAQAITIPALRKDIDPWKITFSALQQLYVAGHDIQWNEVFRGCVEAQQVIAIPSYRWDLKNYWIPYRNNFCLTKGDGMVPTESPNQNKKPASLPFISSSVHRILEQKDTVNGSSLLVEADIRDQKLVPITSGHKVNGAMLCPSSLYADMALTIAKLMLSSRSTFDEDTALDCGSMSIQRPLIAQADAISQMIRVSASADWSSERISLSFFSVNETGRKLADHATCVVRLTQKPTWLEEWKRSAYLISSRIAALNKAVQEGTAHNLKRGLVYKLFSTLVDYSPCYQGMQQVLLDSDQLEATATVKFQVGAEGFDWNPCWIDSLGHIAGFIMNGNENTASKDRVFINHGWEAMRSPTQIQANKTYTTHCRMQLESGTTYVGNTHIFDGNELVAIFEGVRFQGVERSILDHLLPNKPLQTTPSKVSGGGHAAIGKPVLPATKVSPKPTAAEEVSAKVLKIIVAEAQIDQTQADFMDANFIDLGIDSLLSLTITSQIKEETGLDFESSLFLEHSTIRSLLRTLTPDTSFDSTPVRSMSPSDDGNMSDYDTDATSVTGNYIDSENNLMEQLRNVIAQETGASPNDIVPSASLTELGVDSLSALTIIATFEEQTGIILASNLLVECETLENVEQHLIEAGVISTKSKVEERGQISSGQSHQSWQQDVIKSPPHVTSVILQGSRRANSKSKTLFMFPDGAGSATSYMHIPNIGRDVVVCGLNCPWLREPENMKCTFEQYVAKFIIEIRRRQPEGPYHFGGASAGGILAYEAAQQLSQVGQRVSNLVLLDTPDPVGLENPNSRMYDFLDSMGMFGMMGTTTPKWLRPHFDAFLVMLDAYKVKRFDSASLLAPTTWIIYAKDGMCKYESDPRPEIRADDPREMLWLLNNRTDFSGAGWNSLVGSQNLRISVLEDVNHYTIMQKGPGMQELSSRIALAMCSEA